MPVTTSMSTSLTTSFLVGFQPCEDRTTLECRKIANTIGQFNFFGLFSDDMETLIHLAKKIMMREIDKNQYLFRQGDAGDVFYVLYEGAITITTFVPNVVKGAPDVEKDLKQLHKGDTFGETALKMPGGKRGANAKAEQNSILLIIQCEDFLAIEEEHEVFINAQKMKMVQRCPAFKDFGQAKLDSIVSKMSVKMYDAHNVITSRGEASPDLCLIRKGLVKVLKSTPLDLCEVKMREDDDTNAGLVEESPGMWVIQRKWREVMEPKNSNMTTMDQIATETNNHEFTVGILGSGEFFGELAVLEASEASPVTVVACTRVEVYCLGHNDVVAQKLHTNHNLKRCLEER